MRSFNIDLCILGEFEFHLLHIPGNSWIFEKTCQVSKKNVWSGCSASSPRWSSGVFNVSRYAFSYSNCISSIAWWVSKYKVCFCPVSSYPWTKTSNVVSLSRCTINPGENEAVVRYALDTYKFLSLAPQVRLDFVFRRSI